LLAFIHTHPILFSILASGLGLWFVLFIPTVFYLRTVKRALTSGMFAVVDHGGHPWIWLELVPFVGLAAHFFTSRVVVRWLNLADAAEAQKNVGTVGPDGVDDGPTSTISSTLFWSCVLRVGTFLLLIVFARLFTGTVVVADDAPDHDYYQYLSPLIFPVFLVFDLLIWGGYWRSIVRAGKGEPAEEPSLSVIDEEGL
jgi:hypothetical protein